MNLRFSIVSYLLGQDPKVLVSSGPDRSRSAGGLSECELRQEFGIWGAVRKKDTILENKPYQPKSATVCAVYCVFSCHAEASLPKGCVRASSGKAAHTSPFQPLRVSLSHK